MVVHMSIYDKVYESGLHEVAEMDGLERTQFMNYTLGGKNEAYNKKEAHEWFMGNNKDFRQICDLANLDPDHVHSRYKWCLENKVIVFTEIQCYWIEYKNEYRKYRSVGTKEERKTIKQRIDQIRFKLKLKDKKK
jgi:hypothetical protein